MLKRHASQKQIFERKKKKELFESEIFFLLVDLFTVLLIFVLFPNYLIHHWKSYVNHYTTGVISGHTFNF